MKTINCILLFKTRFLPGLQGNHTGIEKNPKTLVPFIHYFSTNKSILLLYELIYIVFWKHKVPEDRQPLSLYCKVPHIIERHYLISNVTKFARIRARTSKLQPWNEGCQSDSLSDEPFSNWDSSQTEDTPSKPRHTSCR